MQLGIVLTNALPDHVTQEEVMDGNRQQAVRAEELGFDDVWILEHHFTRYGICPAPLTMAAFLAGCTSRIGIGTAISVVSLDHPVRLAEQAAMVDQLSGGRLLFGIGRGIATKDFPVFGVDPSTTDERMRLSYELMVAAWTEEVVESDSPLCPFPPVPVYPAPRTKPHPPLYVAAESPSTVEWAARHGIAVMLPFWLDPQIARSQLDLYDEIAEDAGVDPTGIDHVVACIAHVADSRDEAQAAVLPHLDWWLRVGDRATLQLEELRKLDNYGYHLRRWEQRLLTDRRPDERDTRAANLRKVMELNPVGTPEQCVEALAGLAETTGVRHFACGFEGPARREDIIVSMGRFAAEVVPHLQ